jgi:hypothetical protein
MHSSHHLNLALKWIDYYLDVWGPEDKIVLEFHSIQYMKFAQITKILLLSHTKNW